MDCDSKSGPSKWSAYQVMAYLEPEEQEAKVQYKAAVPYATNSS